MGIWRKIMYRYTVIYNDLTVDVGTAPTMQDVFSLMSARILSNKKKVLSAHIEKMVV